MSRKRQSKSAQWRRAQEQDSYTRAAHTQGYRSRAAFKLLEIDAKSKLFRRGARVADLGCAPGGWLQVAVQKTDGLVVGVDLLPVEPIAGTHVLRGDFREETTVTTMMTLLNGRADVVLSDMAPNLSGIAATDQARAATLLRAAMVFALRVLPPTGCFLAKGFQGDDFMPLLRDMKTLFAAVKVVRPQASRAAIREVYCLACGVRKA